MSLTSVVRGIGSHPNLSPFLIQSLPYLIQGLLPWPNSSPTSLGSMALAPCSIARLKKKGTPRSYALTRSKPNPFIKWAETNPNPIQNFLEKTNPKVKGSFLTLNYQAIFVLGSVGRL